MHVLGLCSYPVEAAATRYRLIQFIESLAEKGIELEVSSFLDKEQFELLYKKRSFFEKLIRIVNPILRRFAELRRAGRYNAIFVQREAMFFGPAFFEWIFQKIGKTPLILDLDDATYVSYVSPTYGKIGSFFKFFGKTDNLIKRAETVVCGNRFIAEYAEKKGAKTVIIPTVVDTDKFVPVERKNDVPVIGWIGTHSTFPLLESIFPVFQKLAEKHRFVLKIVGAGRANIELEGVEIDNSDWDLKREIADFQSLDIGLYPIVSADSASNEWLLGKSGFKAIQYMAVGIPFVMTPIGVCAEIGDVDVTHFTATSAEEWYQSLEKLISQRDLREKMGAAARQYSLANFTLAIQSEKLAEVFQSMNRIHS